MNRFDFDMGAYDCRVEDRVGAIYDDADQLVEAMRNDPAVAEAVRATVTAVHDRLDNVRGAMVWNDGDTIEEFLPLANALDLTITKFAKVAA